VGKLDNRLIIILDLTTVLAERDFLHSKFRKERVLQ
jgi:hypothetical protein